VHSQHLTTRGTVLLEHQVIAQLAKEFPLLDGTRCSPLVPVPSHTNLITGVAFFM
jgi:hypothetical protein